MALSYEGLVGQGRDILANLQGKRYKTSADLFKDQQAYEQALQEFNAANADSGLAAQAIGFSENELRPELQRAGGQMQTAEDIGRQDEARKAMEAEQAMRLKAEQEAGAKREAELRARFDAIMPHLEAGLAQKINQQFIPARQKLLSEEKALGRLDSPVSIVPLSNLDAQRENAMGAGLGQLAAQRAAGEMDFAKTLENMLAGERRAGEQVTQFNQGLGLQRQGLAERARMFNDQLGFDRENAIQDRILKGKAIEAGRNDKDLLDKVGQGFGIANSAMNFFSGGLTGAQGMQEYGANKQMINSPAYKKFLGL